MYLNAYLEVCEAYGWQGGPSFNTRIITLANGRERRNANWSQPQMRYDLPFMNIPHEEYGKVLSMFMVCQGQLNAFRYFDPLNNAATDYQFGVGDGATDEFQLSAIFTVGSVAFARNVYALRSTPVIEVDGTPTGSVTIDTERGLVLFAAAPGVGAVLTWTGSFDVWVRFNQDDLPFSLDSRNGDADEIVNGSVNLIEVPPPPLVSS